MDWRGYSAEKLSKSGCLFPLETHGDRRPWTVLSGGQPVGSQVATGPALPFPPGPCGPSRGLGAVSSVDLRESSGPPLAPPTKRHCRSLSEPDELARCRSPWRPGGSKVWTPVSKRRCHSGGSATLQGGPGPSLLGSTESPGGAFPEASPTPPPAPRPASASSGFADGSRGGTGPPWCPGPCALSSRRRLSLSQEHLADVGSPPCTPEPGRRLGLPRSRSQPCVLPGRRGRLKRRREGDARWPRPSLDFLKMTRVRLPPASRADLLTPLLPVGGSGDRLAGAGLCSLRSFRGVLRARRVRGQSVASSSTAATPPARCLLLAPFRPRWPWVWVWLAGGAAGSRALSCSLGDSLGCGGRPRPSRAEPAPL
ncbi:protein FAM53A isoform X1 [Pteropus vampyrus]|uniref:Protein FAM53A isoform X1 n=1 Tax=Pteropus vampyrus TaxID=132908 RepID=A0A6P3R892_PTEVA|nr:protein FAM53A isoform X1 [Pteropus vampyrus]